MSFIEGDGLGYQDGRRIQRLDVGPQEEDQGQKEWRNKGVFEYDTLLLPE